MSEYPITSARGKASTPEKEKLRREKISKAIRERLSSEEGLKAHKEMARNSWQNPAIRQKRIEGLRAAWRRKDVRDKHLQSMKAIMSEANRRKWQREEYRKLQTEIQIKAWQDPKIRQRRSAGISEAIKKIWADPIVRARRIKALRKHDDPYKAKLANNALRRAQRKNATGIATLEQIEARVAYWGWRCWICGRPYEAIDHVIPIAKGGTHWPANLRPICSKCNSRKRDRSWRLFLKPENAS